jgi:hypothetical protein
LLVYFEKYKLHAKGSKEDELAIVLILLLFFKNRRLGGRVFFLGAVSFFYSLSKISARFLTEVMTFPYYCLWNAHLGKRFHSAIFQGEA